MLIGAVQESLLGCGDEPVQLRSIASIRRTWLGDDAWVDIRTSWLGGADQLLRHLLDAVPWRAERRRMYERVVDVPRLVRHYGEGRPLPHPVLAQARDELSAHYCDELGEPFRTAGLCLYRDGRDSVAWHGDRVGRGADHDTMVAVLGVGAARPLALRPRGGGPARRIPLGHGDLVVMGGSCQRTWDHAILKTTRPVGPRISIQYRPRGVL
ncbi:MAG: alpha-ketoglutarate-dependent dioxygenase AlkB [Angustibacter sp.]